MSPCQSSCCADERNNDPTTTALEKSASEDHCGQEPHCMSGAGEQPGIVNEIEGCSDDSSIKDAQDGCCSDRQLKEPNRVHEDEESSASTTVYKRQSGCCSEGQPKKLPIAEKAIKSIMTDSTTSCCSAPVAGSRDGSTEHSTAADAKGCCSFDDVTAPARVGNIDRPCAGSPLKRQATNCRPSTKPIRPQITDTADGCCAGTALTTQMTGCCPPGQAMKLEKDDCCGSSSAISTNTQAANLTLRRKYNAEHRADGASAAVCAIGSCTSEVHEKQTEQALSCSDDICCDPKEKSNCCDDTCIDRLVKRDCENNDDCIGQHTKSETTTATRSDECCPNGITARRFYRNLLKSLGCLCRTAKARGEETCCNQKRRAVARVRYAEHASTGKQSSCEGTGRGTPCKMKCLTSNHRQLATCYEDETSFGKTMMEKVDPSQVDLEKGENADSKHVILSVSGMTCTGCEVKLQRSLGTIKTLKNVKTSLVMCRAEFDLDTRKQSPRDLIQQLERMTDFKIEEISQNGYDIEVLPSNISLFLQQALPLGVIDMQGINKSTVKIVFDPKIVGARDLVERGFGDSVPLAPINADPSLAAGGKHVRHTGLMTLLSASLTVPVLVLAWAPLPQHALAYDTTSLVLATLVQFVVAGPFYPAAIKSLVFSRLVEMDLLIVISTSAAYIFSVVAFAYTVAGRPLSTGEFFETSTLLVTLIMVGRWVSALARHKAMESISMRSLQIPTAVLVDESASVQREIDARLLQYGDLFRVAPESRIPTDGTVVSGHSEVDESLLTGESTPVSKKPGSAVIAGSINGSGLLIVRLSRLPSDNTISTIANMVDEAKLSKPKIQEIADKVASIFVPTVIALGLVVFLIWIPIGLRIRDYGASEAVINALTYAITVIIVSCPCAIGLAVPMVIMIASGVAAKHGCIFKSAISIEVARKTKHLVFDKTGTLTQGKLTVASSKYFPAKHQTTASIGQAALSLLADIKHPVAVAVSKFLDQQGVTRSAVVEVTSLPGQGVQGYVNGDLVKAGNSRWLELSDDPDVRGYLKENYTTFCVTINGRLVALFGLQDALRPDTLDAITELHSRGIEISIVSGDDDGPVSALARQLGISSYKSRCTPADKKNFMQSISQNGKVTTMFCGDGTNDAVALAQATIGIHMNEGTDVASSAADVTLTRSSLADVLTLIDLSKAAMRRVAFNFGWAFTYNTLAILLASGALVNARIPPQYAGLGELVSVLPVIAIAMQLRWARF